MKLLLTSAGVRNPAIRDALTALLPRPVDQCTALAIPTAMYGHPHATLEYTWEFAAGRSESPMTDLGWQSVGLLELTALPSLPREQWLPDVRRADVLLASGGDAVYLAYWMRECGLADLLPSLTDTVWVGMSAGSMVMTPRIGPDFMQWQPPDGSDRTLGLVNFSLFPHVDHPDMPDNVMVAAQRWAATLDNPSYAIDDETAIAVDGDRVEVASAGHWQYFPG
ncbi:dipeptidase E [Jatrophihabitans endophyticus]|uniref:Dipeptidase E n=1 Tax=Jatrophihabitans endophyticus TaxID=1206085 RepID=A0A1M5HRH5_9ACTN|nr:Type 1 glutamine amidotransferase-like domain-containing protein [Jatrophihabitans endophyticus]SHG18546.1 dipeptidase E [Jatrophihabitans endophyticus]